VSDLFAWGSEQDNIDIKLYEQLQQLSTVELLNELDKAAPGDSVKDRKRYNHIIAIIADKLNVPLRKPIGLFVNDIFGDLLKRVDELEKQFKTHRHDTSKTYTEKPAW